MPLGQKLVSKSQKILEKWSKVVGSGQRMLYNKDILKDYLC